MGGGYKLSSTAMHSHRTSTTANVSAMDEEEDKQCNDVIAGWFLSRSRLARILTKWDR